jgi:multicomponent Na+:H+ antiporter subunit E
VERSRSRLLGAVIFRAIIYGLIWVTLAGMGWADLLIGAIAVALATAASLKLLPPSANSLSPLGVLAFSIDFVRSSIVAGFDVARRAFDPRLPIHPGFVTCSCSIDAGAERDAYRAAMSLQPGTLPVADLGQAGFVIHCLDTREPVQQSFARSEVLFRRLLRPRSGDG